MKIAKVKLIQNGLKGIEVNFQDTTEKDGMTFHDEHTVKFSSPIHKELRKSVERLKYFLIDLYKHRQTMEGYIDKDTFHFIYNEKGKGGYFKAQEIWEAFSINGITSNGVGNFIIMGSMVSFGNTKVACNSPKVTEEAGYDYFEEVIEIVNTIYSEVEKYVKKGAMADDKQLIIDFYTAKGEMEKVAEVETLTREQMVAQAQQLLENLGGIVLMPEDMSGEEEEEATQEVDNEEDDSWGAPEPKLKIAQ